MHLSSDSSRLAIGSEVAGAGRAYIYDTADGTLPLHQFEHAKPVWCVRLSPPATMMAVAGYDMALTLYDVTRAGLQGARCPVLQRVAYTSKIGPAFIWSAEFSEDGEAIILGCWSGFAFVYTIDFERAKQVAAAALSWDEADGADGADGASGAGADASQTRADTPGGDTPRIGDGADAPATESAVLTQAAAVDRGERVYAVDCNADASRLVVGGRDKKVAMFDTERHVGDAHTSSARAANPIPNPIPSPKPSHSPDPSPNPNPSQVRTDEPPMLWEVVSEDFIYCCSMSADFQYCAYGGTARVVVVLNALNGRALYQVPTPDYGHYTRYVCTVATAYLLLLTLPDRAARYGLDL